MIAELGHFALILAMLMAVLGGVAVPLSGAARVGAALSLAQRAAGLVFLLSVLAAAALTWSFAVNDFSVRYVAAHSHSTLPLGYRLVAVWGSHEGSMLLWTTTLAGWSAAVALAADRLGAPLGARVLAVLAWIQVGLCAFVLFSSNPFTRLIPAPADGRDLNALLQDPGMALHPPALYLGYVGFAVPFAFAVATLWQGELRPPALRWLRPWALAAWAALTVGIVLGSTWAYRVLGWGGWWFWDPVENASLLPWLAGLALLHTLAAAEAREQFKRWVLLLAIAGFGLSLIGTFIVRSGAITSVHAFATDPRRGVFILAMLAASVGSALLLFGARAHRLGGGPAFAPVSRESFLLANGLLFSVATGSVLLATVYPMVIDALRLGKISVGPPYFEAVLAPLMAPAVFLMAAAPLARWRLTPTPELVHRLRWAFAVSVAAALLALVLGRASAMLGLGFLLAAWVLAAGTVAVWRARPRTASGWGMHLAHLGVGVFVLGVTVLKGYEIEREVPMRAGEQVQVGPYAVQLDGFDAIEAVNHRGVRARLTLFAQGQPVTVLAPESRAYLAQDMTVSAPSIHSTVWRDVYVALGEQLAPGTWGVRVQYKPLMWWVWAGFLMMAAGAVLALCDRRYRVASRAARAATVIAGPGEAA
nr:heme lyase CcmF/NrfE family subunit [uncultured Caldimonas sp.]